MQKLFEFFYRYRILILFLLLEVFSFWLIVNNNTYQTASFFNSSNSFTGTVIKVQNNIESYFGLRSVNRELAEENRKLREILTKEQQKRRLYKEENLIKIDTVKWNQFKYIAAEVINNSSATSTNRTSNYFTIDKGTNQGIVPGMGVLSVGGVAGKVKSCSGNFSTVTSMLHERWSLSSKIKRDNIDGITKWLGGDVTEADLQYVGKHHKVYVGDTIITSGYNSIFPQGVIIGTVKSVVDDGKKYIIKVKLATDYSAMSYVYVVENKLQVEKDSLESETKMNQE